MSKGAPKSFSMAAAVSNCCSTASEICRHDGRVCVCVCVHVTGNVRGSTLRRAPCNRAAAASCS